MKTITRTVADYLRRPYTIQLRQYGDGTFFAEVAELPGCVTEADSADEALDMIRDAMAGWIEVALSEGLPIPEPTAEVGYSGRFLVRTPKSLHRDLAQRARAEGASLNQFVVTTLSRALGGRGEVKPRTRRSVRSSPPSRKTPDSRSSG
jgi:antitoxin HicB